MSHWWKSIIRLRRKLLNLSESMSHVIFCVSHQQKSGALGVSNRRAEKDEMRSSPRMLKNWPLLKIFCSILGMEMLSFDRAHMFAHPVGPANRLGIWHPVISTYFRTNNNKTKKQFPQNENNLFMYTRKSLYCSSLNIKDPQANYCLNNNFYFVQEIRIKLVAPNILRMNWHQGSLRWFFDKDQYWICQGIKNPKTWNMTYEKPSFNLCISLSNVLLHYLFSFC